MSARRKPGDAKALAETEELVRAQFERLTSLRAKGTHRLQKFLTADEQVALGEIYKLAQPWIEWRLGGRSNVDDIVARVFSRFIQNFLDPGRDWPGTALSEAPLRMMLKIGHYEAMHLDQTQRRREALARVLARFPDQESSSPESPEEIAAAREGQALAFESVSKNESLSENERKVFKLVLEDHNAPEIAAKLSMSEGAVRQVLARAGKKLRRGTNR